MMKMRSMSKSLLMICFGLVAAAPGADEVVTVKVHVDSHYQGYEGHRAMDGNPETMWHTDCQFYETRHPHEILVDLGAPYELAGFAYLPRRGGGNGTIGKYECYVGDDVKDLGKPVVAGTFAQRNAENVVRFPTKRKGRYLLLRALSEVNGRPWTSIAELRPLADGIQFRAGSSVVDRPRGPIAPPPPELDVQFAVLQHDLGNRAHFDQVASETFRPEALIQPSDRDPVDVVLRRTAALLADLKRMHPAPDLGGLEAELGRLREREPEGRRRRHKAARRALFEEICRVRRADRLLQSRCWTSTRSCSSSGTGRSSTTCATSTTASPPGRAAGCTCSSDPFGPEPQVRDVLADSVVERGRLKGQKLTGGRASRDALLRRVGNLNGPDQEGGSFLSPDLSYDGKTIALRLRRVQGRHSTTDHHTDPTAGHWDEGRCYHVFKVNVDGTGLEQLTDGTWNDFDPCWLPNGRIAFITERRGGYLRCGRVCPTYTLYDMAADGSDIRCLSFHETNEWHPSVTHDGRIIYTRWDYVDRHGCTAHHAVDHHARRPRLAGGARQLRSAQAPARHGTRLPRDPRLAQDSSPPRPRTTARPSARWSWSIRTSRTTTRWPRSSGSRPRSASPRARAAQQVYGTAWPLSEDYYLCVYDAGMQPACGRQGRGTTGQLRHLPGRRLRQQGADLPRPGDRLPEPDAAAGRGPCRRRRRRWPSRSATRPARACRRASRRKGTMAVINVYDSLKPWPEGRRSRPCACSSPADDGSLGRTPAARDRRSRGPRPATRSSRPATCSAPCRSRRTAAPTSPCRPIARSSSRPSTSGAWPSSRCARPPTCSRASTWSAMGCHEPQAPRPACRPTGSPLALQRAPSSIRSPTSTAPTPFSYPRLVQPVLDRHCVTCHAEHPDKPINLAREPIQKQVVRLLQQPAADYGFSDYGDSLPHHARASSAPGRRSSTRSSRRATTT